MTEFPISRKNYIIDGAVERQLWIHLREHSHNQRVFLCVGDTSFFPIAGMSDFLCNQLGYTREKVGVPESSATILLVSQSEHGESCLDSVLDSAPDIKIIFIAATINRTKTPFISTLEKHGFRVSFERGKMTCMLNIQEEVEILASRLPLRNSEVQRQLVPSQRYLRQLPDTTSVDVVSVPGQVLLTPERFDIAIKCLYGRLWKQGRAQAWRENAYFEQALRMTGPGRDVKEYDGSGKSGIEQFMALYHSLLQDLEPDRLPLVPVDRRWIAFDGAHRIAAALVMDRKIRVAQIDAPRPSLQNASFFAGISHEHQPCPPAILDEAAIEYCRMKRGLALALIFPVVRSEHFAIDCLRNVSRTVYRKDVVLSPGAGRALLRQIYLGHEWLPEAENSEGFSSKVNGCFPFHGTVRAILIDDFEESVLRDAKERIRSHYGLGNHSIHITDGDDEVLRISRLMFNRNSVDILRSESDLLPDFHRHIFIYRDWLERYGLDDEAFCVSGGGIVALLGLRECRDIDFLYHGNIETLPERPPKIDCHNSLEGHFRYNIADIVGSPDLHCWYMGIKFCLPQLIVEMKRSRGEDKDYVDVALLESNLSDSRYIMFWRIWKSFRTRLRNYVMLIKFRIRMRLKG